MGFAVQGNSSQGRPHDLCGASKNAAATRGVSVGWFERLCARLRRRHALRAAEAHRAECYRAWRDARDRGDTRAEHYAHRAYLNATTAVVRLELGR